MPALVEDLMKYRATHALACRMAHISGAFIDPAILDVNKLSDLNVSLRVNRRHARAPISSIDIGWGKKSGEEFREVQQELNRSKVGRPARLKGQGENIRQQILIPTLPLE
jgi:hypothetical protein